MFSVVLVPWCLSEQEPFVSLNQSEAQKQIIFCALKDLTVQRPGAIFIRKTGWVIVITFMA